MASQKLKDFVALAVGTVIGTTISVILLALILSAMLDRLGRSPEPAEEATSMCVIFPPPGNLPADLVLKKGVRVRIADGSEFGAQLDCAFDHWNDETARHAQMTDCRAIGR